MNPLTMAFLILGGVIAGVVILACLVILASAKAKELEARAAQILHHAGLLETSGE